MERGRQNATDIDRKLAIYYHPLFQEVIGRIVALFGTPSQFQVGLLEFVQFNLKLQKCLLPAFEIENALVSALNDWVKEVAECLNYEGMVSTAGCEEVTPTNLQALLRREAAGMGVRGWAEGEEYFAALGRVASHDAFKLLGVRINREVFNKFMFDLCSTWCEFLDIELFTYFLVAIYVQLSEGSSLSNSQFRPTQDIPTIDLQFMEEFEEIKSLYSRNRKKELRYYRAWCEWNYLRINDIGEALILHLDQLHHHDPRILELATLFEKAIEVINEEITVQHQPAPPKEQPPPPPQGDTDFLIAKKIGPDPPKPSQPVPAPQSAVVPEEPQENHQFEIEIDSQGNMYLRKVVRLPVIGTRVAVEAGEKREAARWAWVERKRQEVRQVSNLYRRLENMKVRLEHNPKNDPYAHKVNPQLKEREQFYGEQQQVNNQYSNLPVQQIIHAKQPQPSDPPPAPVPPSQPLFKPELMEEKKPIRQNHYYIHKTMAPKFLTDSEHDISYSKGQEGTLYGVGPYAEKRDLKLGLPKLAKMQQGLKSHNQSYHVVGKLTRNRKDINERVKSYSMVGEEKVSRVEKEREEYRHVWGRYISEEEMGQLTNYRDFYGRLEEAKRYFSKDYQSEYRLNLKQIFIYENKRYEMGGVITTQQQNNFYQRMAKLIKRDQRRNNRRKRKQKLRDYRRAVGSSQHKQLFEGIFLDYHRKAIRSLKEVPPAQQ